MKVSIVVAARNERPNLETFLPRLLEQNFPDFEVLIIDDRSTDGTSDFLSDFKHPKLRFFRISDKPEHLDGKKNALTKGIEKAQGEVILLTDADCYPASEHWISLMTAPFSREEIQIVLGYSPYERRRGLLNKFIQFETLNTASQYLTSARLGIPYMGVGRNLAYRKTLFDAVGGLKPWQEQVGGDDDLFVGTYATAKNTITVTHPESHVFSVPKQNFRAWLRQKIRHLGVGNAYRLKNRIWVALWQFLQLGSLILAWWTLFFYSDGMAVWGIRYLFWGTYFQYNKAKDGLNSSLVLIEVFTFELIFLVYYFAIGAIVTLRPSSQIWRENTKDNSRIKH
ncbi:MAG: glycosyltransferase [Bacteroidota bacterium]